MSYAAAIKDALGVETTIETGSRGQFSVYVDGQEVSRRKGGLLAMIMRKPSPSDQDIVDAVKSAKAS